MKLKELANNYINLLNKDITVSGWVLTKREQKDLAFVKLTDGSNTDGVQLIFSGKYDDLDKLHIGTSIRVEGTLVNSPAKGQNYEINVTKLKIIGCTDLELYPLSKGRLPLDYLRNYCHLRTRTSTFGSVFRIKSAISNATHEFFKNKGYLHLNPNIMTSNECEGGAGTFKVTEHNLTNHLDLPKIKNTLNHDYSQDHFDKAVQLTVSSQLQLEALACSLGAVYTTNKSFRSEHSNTSKHLSEFEHLEIEDIFITLEELMQVGEDYIKFVGSYLLKNSIDDIINLDKFVSKGLHSRINLIVNTKFERITYTSAIDLLKKANLSKPVEYGEDLSSEMETYLTDYFKCPVFVYNWPLSIKSFYMKQNSVNTDLCDNFDLLMPYKVGEMIGGSMREDNLDIMLNTMKKKGINPEPLNFFLDLRRYGTVEHGGFGLGLDRMCMLFTGMENIKDVVTFPVSYRQCNY